MMKVTKNEEHNARKNKNRSQDYERSDNTFRHLLDSHSFSISDSNMMGDQIS